MRGFSRVAAKAAMVPVLAAVPVLGVAASASASVILVPPQLVGPVLGIGHGHAEKPPTSCGARATGAPQTLPVAVTPRRGAVTVRWWAPNDPDVARYAIAVVPQTLRPGKQPPIRWQTVAAGSRCTWHGKSFGGLRRGEYYDVWVDVRLKRHDGKRGLIDRTVGRSGAFVAP